MRQLKHKDEVLAHVREMSGKSRGVFGLPERWQFDYPWSLVKTGFWLWMTSGFEKLPTQEQVMAYDPRWITDMQLMYQIYAFYKNDSPLFDIMRQQGMDEEERVYENVKNNDSEAMARNWSTFLEQMEQGNIRVEQ